MASPERSLPTGTITFLRTDIESSTRLAQALGRDWGTQVARHHAIVRAAIRDHGGSEVRTEGDAFLIAFQAAAEAAAAAAVISTAMANEPWPVTGAIRVRVGLDAGVAERSNDDYSGSVLHRTARIADAASGGQILVSDVVRALVAGDLPAGCSLRDLGWFRLRGFEAPEHLFQLDVPGLASDHPPLRGVIPDTDHLPLEATRFIGRRQDLERLEALLRTTRLLTITGPGGTGKTRMAIELGRRVLRRYRDGAWFIDLSTVTDPDDVLPAIARGLGLFDGPTGPAAGRLDDHLAGRSMLLVLDNLEQVVEAARDIGRLLRVGPGLVVLVTSRVPLGLAAEQVVPLRPLATGPADPPEALELFLDRLGRARPDLVVDARIRSTAREICVAVDGLPLGIELAAARARTLPLGAIRDRLAIHAALPGTAPRDLPARQQTLQRTIAWSLGLLPADRLAFFGRLGVFEGGFALEQVEDLEASLGDGGVDALEGLMTLADHSLIALVDHLGEPRYEMLETIRAGSHDLLMSGRAGWPEADLRRRHAAAFCALAVRAALDWGTRRQAESLARLARDHANLRAAIGWAIASGEVELARSLSASLWRYWLMRGGLIQGRALAEAVLAMPGGDAPDASLVGALDAAGGLAYWMADPVVADTRYARQLEVARALGDAQAVGDAAFNLSHTRFVTGDADGQFAALREAEAAYRQAGDARGLFRVDYGRAVVRAIVDQSETTRSESLELLGRAERLDDLPYVALTASAVALMAMRTGDVASSLRYGLLALSVSRRLDDRPSIALTFLPAAIIALGMERPLDAARFLGLFGSLCQLHGFRPPAGLETFSLIEDPVSIVQSMLGDDTYEAAAAQGRAMSIDEAVEMAFALGRAAGVEVRDIW